MWNTIKTNLGSIKSKTENIVKFIYVGNIKIDTANIKPPCSCTNVEWNPSTNTMTVVYKPKVVPIHLKEKLNKKSYTDVKTIIFEATINNVDGIKQSLSIIATVYDELPNKS